MFLESLAVDLKRSCQDNYAGCCRKSEPRSEIQHFDGTGDCGLNCDPSPHVLYSSHSRSHPLRTQFRYQTAITVALKRDFVIINIINATMMWESINNSNIFDWDSALKISQCVHRATLTFKWSFRNLLIAFRKTSLALLEVEQFLWVIKIFSPNFQSSSRLLENAVVLLNNWYMFWLQLERKCARAIGYILNPDKYILESKVKHTVMSL